MPICSGASTLVHDGNVPEEPIDEELEDPDPAADDRGGAPSDAAADATMRQARRIRAAAARSDAVIASNAASAHCARMLIALAASVAVAREASARAPARRCGRRPAGLKVFAPFTTMLLLSLVVSFWSGCSGADDPRRASL